MITLEGKSDCVLLPLLVTPGASRARILGEHDGRLKVAVTAAPERGKANQAVVRLLAKELGVKRSQVAIVSGETSRLKTVAVEGLSEAELAERLEKLIRR